ncbi:MAG TPA: hypothetical protein VD963_10135, partial [Phycisphaerales bacterium]|nr:hypothetical protein [Phycisphaerales bacterium]
LLRWPGVGPYAAANIMQLLGRYARLPLDTESLRHGKTVLGYTGTDGAILRALHAHYAPMGPHAFRSYWFELWAFYESRRGPAWTWDQETTAATFTAAKWRAEERAAAGRSPRALPHRGLQPDATAEVRMMRSHSPPGHLHRGGGGTASMDRR